MSWAEIKKAVNSNFSIPLNELIASGNTEILNAIANASGGNLDEYIENYELSYYSWSDTIDTFESADLFELEAPQNSILVYMYAYFYCNSTTSSNNRGQMSATANIAINGKTTRIKVYPYNVGTTRTINFYAFSDFFNDKTKSMLFYLNDKLTSNITINSDTIDKIFANRINNTSMYFPTSNNVALSDRIPYNFIFSPDKNISFEQPTVGGYIVSDTFICQKDIIDCSSLKITANGVYESTNFAPKMQYNGNLLLLTPKAV